MVAAIRIPDGQYNFLFTWGNKYLIKSDNVMKYCGFLTPRTFIPRVIIDSVPDGSFTIDYGKVIPPKP